MKENKSLKSKWFRWLKITVATVVGIWAALLVVLQLLLNSSFLTRMAEKYIPEYVDADVHIGKISASMLKSFPNLQLDVDNVPDPAGHLMMPTLRSSIIRRQAGNEKSRLENGFPTGVYHFQIY